MKRVCHLSSVHRGLDIRIFRKQCASLAKAGYDTHLVISASAADVVDAARQGVTVHALPAAPGRLRRMLLDAGRCYRRARRLDADLYHCHDPELIPYGLLLARSGKPVIFDAHEDLPADIRSKQWIPAPVRRLVASACGALQNIAARRFAAVVAATPYIGSTFEGAARRVMVINNYPLFGELSPAAQGEGGARDSVCYVGGIDVLRGIRQVVEALSTAGVTLHLAGNFSCAELRSGVARMPGWRQVKYHGVLDRRAVAGILGRSLAGLVTFLPDPNAMNAQPNKMFEYMSAGVPVIASDFPLWRQLVEDAGCGICVDPRSPEQIARAIRHLRDHPEEVARMGDNGRRAVERTYRWDHEEAKLLALYQSLLAE